MIDEKTWEEFRESGLLWWINRSLHLLGWAIVMEKDDSNCYRVFPARVKFRGFDSATEAEGFIKVTDTLNKTSDTLLDETKLK